ncbi:sulfatase-like hydrolase/transferase [Flammeovirga sp. OC4]|uniref:sulfatase-like hydrolase/transferase n=1 Tax=Flammeovirga sp. OC4 TaxID=1382345 RepID=UPI0009E3CF4A|nr:sulfatase [Flammeovirga sp. OC4]
MHIVRYLLYFLCFLMWSCAGNSTSLPNEENNPKPNILWITLEDTSPHFIGAYGNKQAKTPNMDALAREGFKMNNAFSTATVCSPSRSCIITGVHANRLGTANHRSTIEIPSDVKAFPYYLKKAGYFTTNNNKTDYNLAEEKNKVKEAWDFSKGKTGWWDRTDSKQPFFSVFNLMTSHESYTMVNPHAFYEKKVRNVLSEVELTKPESIELPPFYADNDEMRSYMARMYDCITLTDKKIGEIINRLKEDGLFDNTIIFVFADHGEGLPRFKGAGLNLGHQVPMFVHIPQKYKHLLAAEKEEFENRVISFEDLAPSVLSLAGVEKPQYMQGENIFGQDYQRQYVWGGRDGCGEVIDQVRTVTDGRYTYVRNYMTDYPIVQWHKYSDNADILKKMHKDTKEKTLDNVQYQVLGAGKKGEWLFDNQKDKWNVNDLSNEEEYQNVLAKFRSINKNEILNQRDLHFIPAGQMDRLAKGSNPFEAMADDKVYPLENILYVAELSGRGHYYKDKQLAYLASTVSMQRYWALVGLRAQELDQEDLPKIEKLLEDENPFNQIEAATILYRMKHDIKAKKVLENHGKSDNAFIAWHAVRAVQMMPISEYKAFEKTFRYVTTSLKERAKLNRKHEIYNAINSASQALEIMNSNY